MIQKGTFLNVIDNSGAKTVCCIHVPFGYRKKTAKIGDIIIVSIKVLRSKRKAFSKVKKGEVIKALIVKTKSFFNFNFFETLKFFENSVVLLNTQKKLLGTRIFGSISKNFRYTRYLRVTSLASGIIN